MIKLRVALYARVSGEEQVEEATIASQLDAIYERVKADEGKLSDEMQFIDDGYSGSTLMRPALDQLRDLAALNGLDRLYVHDPDRFSRRYAYQVLLLEEFRQAGVEVVFLIGGVGGSPEDELLLQIQGVFAEYERAKMLERSRRGKRYAAKSGKVAVLAGAPYGYHYVTKQDGGGQARYEVIFEEARVVRQIFEWIGRDRLSLGEVCRRLTQAGVPTRTGKTVWDRSVILGMLKNPAYKGMAAYGKTRSVPMKPRLRPQRGHPLYPRRPISVEDVPTDEWLSIPVPALVDEALFEAAQEQLAENRRHARQRQRGARYLLQGLLVCAQCHYGYYGKAVSNKSAKGKTRDYAYYRCIGTDAYRFGGVRVCDNLQVRTDKLDQLVWEEVCALLKAPHRLEQEYQRRLQSPNKANADLTAVQTQMTKIQQGMSRLIDGYTDGFIEKREFEPRMTHLRQRLADLDAQLQQINDALALQAQLHLVITRLEDFADQVKDGLAEADWVARRDLIRALVKRVEVGNDAVNVVFRVPPIPFDSGPDAGILQHCGGRGNASLWHPFFS
jgi:site-specific DNA recombinase